jgi:hypothetical protein
MLDQHTADCTALDLLHPDGHAQQVLVLGDACPPYLRPALASPNVPDGAVDALLIAPHTRECMRKGWLKHAADAAQRLLGADAVGYVVIARRWRRSFVRLARARGLTVEPFIHAQQGAGNDYLIPCDAAVARHVLSTVPMSRSNRNAWRAVWLAPLAEHIVPRLAPDIVLIVRKPAARPLLEWANGSSRFESPLDKALIRIKTHGDAVTALVSLFSNRRESPVVHRKVAMSPSSSAARLKESIALSGVGPSAGAAGATAPQCELSQTPQGHWVLSMTSLRGRCAATVLHLAPDELEGVADRLASWLGRWMSATARAGHADPLRLDQELLGPAERLARHLTDGDAYLRHLYSLCVRAQGLPLPRVATHGDLTMSNVLLQDDGALAIVDWESARDDGLPLTDWFYCAADALAATERYRDRTAAFASCFDREHAFGGWMWRTTQRLAAECALTEQMTELMKHATVLHHAANELRAPSGSDRPFLAVAQRLCNDTIAAGALT